MKIGLVIYGSLDTVSGGYLYDRKLVGYLRSRGDEVRIVSIPAARYLSHVLGGLRFCLPADVDLIIQDELVHPSLLRANRRRDPHMPVLSLVHNLRCSERRADWQNAFYRQLEKQYLSSVNGFIFNSTVTEASVTALVGEEKPSVLAPPGGDRLGTMGSDLVSKRALKPGPLRLLFLANVTPLKGLQVLLDALKELPAGSCVLDVAGSLQVDGDYAARMRRQAEAQPLPVTFHGVLDDRPLAHLLTGSDVLVVPSYYEGFGIAYLEGMAFGLPAIGTTAGAIPQSIHDGVNGYMIAPGDSAALAGILRQLAFDRTRLVRLSMGALSYFASCPTWDQSAERIRKFLLQMLNQSS